MGKKEVNTKERSKRCCLDEREDGWMDREKRNMTRKHEKKLDGLLRRRTGGVLESLSAAKASAGQVLLGGLHLVHGGELGKVQESRAVATHELVLGELPSHEDLLGVCAVPHQGLQ